MEKKNEITAEEISKNLPMRVRAEDSDFMFGGGSIIRFYEVSSTGVLIGHVVGKTGTKIGVLNPNRKFYLLTNN